MSLCDLPEKHDSSISNSLLCLLKSVPTAPLQRTGLVHTHPLTMQVRLSSSIVLLTPLREFPCSPFHLLPASNPDTHAIPYPSSALRVIRIFPWPSPPPHFSPSLFYADPPPPSPAPSLTCSMSGVILVARLTEGPGRSASMSDLRNKVKQRV